MKMGWVAQTLPCMSAPSVAGIESNVGATHVRREVIFKAGYLRHGGLFAEKYN